MQMKPIELVKALQRDGVPDIDARDAMTLSDLFDGYALANGAMVDVGRALEERMGGTLSLSGFGKAYLTSPNGHEVALATLLSLLERPFADRPAEATVWTADGYPSFVLSAVDRGGRWGMAVAEPTAQCLSNTWIGFVLGASAVDPQLGARQSAELDAFDKWTRSYFETPNVHWTRPLRLFVRDEPIKEFAILWRKFIAERSP
jgi:hypothetical protein